MRRRRGWPGQAPAMTPGLSVPTPSPTPLTGLAAIVPVLIAASCFGFADVATRVQLDAQADVLTMALFRGIIGVPLLLVFIVAGARPKPLTTPARRLSLFIGLLFAGNVFFLFKAIEAMPVPLAILTYFTYPLLTGLAAAATGIERLGLAGLRRGARGVRRPRADDRRAPRRRRARRPRLRGALRLHPRGDPAADAREAAGLRRAADQPVVADGGDRGVHRGGARDRELASAGDDGRLGGAGRLEYRDGDRGADDLRLDRAHRAVPHRAVHEP